MNVKDKPNKIKAKLLVEVESEFYDDEASEETLRYCIEQDLQDAGFNVFDVSVINEPTEDERLQKERNIGLYEILDGKQRLNTLIEFFGGS